MQDKKSKRTFLCRDSLYEFFVQMSQRLDCSVDYLINEAMREYAAAQAQPSSAAPAPATRDDHTMHFVGQPKNEEPEPEAADERILVLISDGVQVVVDKDQFVLGRGSQGTDFVIRDPNISRRHAVVQRREDGYYIKDLGSTNGVEFQGSNVDEKKIEDGDVFKLCTHHVEFRYQ